MKMHSLAALVFAAAPVLAACETNTPEPQAPSSRPRASRRCPPPRHHTIDLAQPMQEGMPVWPGGVPFKMTRVSDYDQGYRAHKFEMGENVGTHVDAPAHFALGKRTLAQIPADELVLPAVVLDLHEKVAGNPDYAVRAGDIGDWEAAHGEVPPGSLVIANTGWAARFRDPAKYLNVDAAGVMHFPGFAVDAVKLLMERDVVAIGIDTASLDPGASKDFDAHKAFLGANHWGIENLANLEKLPPTGTTVVIGVLSVVDGTQAQARVLALVPDADDARNEEDPDASTPSTGH
jgi:kynurenine formamidase